MSQKGVFEKPETWHLSDVQCLVWWNGVSGQKLNTVYTTDLGLLMLFRMGWMPRPEALLFLRFTFIIWNYVSVCSCEHWVGVCRGQRCQFPRDPTWMLGSKLLSCKSSVHSELLSLSAKPSFQPPNTHFPLEGASGCQDMGFCVCHVPRWKFRKYIWESSSGDTGKVKENSQGSGLGGEVQF